jgi:hypothetical protein
MWIMADQLEPLLELDPDGYGIAFVVPAVDGKVWRAEPPAANDRWVAVRRNAEGIVATSWEGTRMTFDPVSGQVLDSTFTK